MFYMYFSFKFYTLVPLGHLLLPFVAKQVGDYNPKQPESITLLRLFGVSPLKGDSLSAGSATKNPIKIICFLLDTAEDS